MDLEARRSIVLTEILSYGLSQYDHCECKLYALRSTEEGASAIEEAGEMVAFVPSAAKSKVAPRRHWSTMQGLLMHSRQLHQVLKTVEYQESREQCRRLLSAIDFQEPVAIVPKPRAIEPKSKPIVFRKTKREIQRERELAQQQQRKKTASASKPVEESLRCQESGVIMRQLDNLRTTLLASCKRLTGSTIPATSHTHQRRLACRSPYLQRKVSGLSRRCPPRRRLLF